MDILFVLDNLADRCGANVGIMLDIASEWRNMGHHLFCLTRRDMIRTVSDRRSEMFDHVWSFDSEEDVALNKFTASDEWIHSNVIGKVMKLLAKPRVLRYYVDSILCGSGIIKREYEHELNSVLEERGFDVIIAVTEPYYLACVSAGCASSIDKVIVMMDPYSNNHNMPHRKRRSRIKKEKSVDEASIAIFAPDYVWKDIDYLPAHLRNRTMSFKIPRISVEEEISRTSGGINVTARSMDAKENVNLVYAGQLYPDIRNPRYMLELFCRLPENYVLHIYGGGTEDVLQEYKKRLGDRLSLHGWVDSTQAVDAMRGADILVNLNNSIFNMLPSKLLEYINTGKPILNISYGDKCPSLDYMVKYPNGLTVCTDGDVTDAVERIKDFVTEAYGRITDHKIIEELYSDCIVTNVAGQMLEQIERARTNGGS